MALTEKVINKDGVEKTVVANSEKELAEAVKAVEGEKAAVSPDINDPRQGNKVGTTSPHTDELVSDRFEANPVTQDGKPLPKPEKPAKVKASNKK